MWVCACVCVGRNAAPPSPDNASVRNNNTLNTQLQIHKNLAGCIPKQFHQNNTVSVKSQSASLRQTIIFQIKQAANVLVSSVDTLSSICRQKQSTPKVRWTNLLLSNLVLKAHWSQGAGHLPAPGGWASTALWQALIAMEDAVVGRSRGLSRDARDHLLCTKYYAALAQQESRSIGNLSADLLLCKL